MIALDRLNAMAFARHLGFVFEQAEDGRSAVSLQTGPEHENLQGRVHGGVLPVLVDAAGATAIASQSDAAVVTADLRVNLIKPVTPGQRVTAVGTVTHAGPSSAFASVVVTAGGDGVVALGQVTCIVKARRAGEATGPAAS